MSEDAIRQEVDRQLAVMRSGAVEFYGEEELAERLAVCLREDRPLLLFRRPPRSSGFFQTGFQLLSSHRQIE